MTLHPGMYPSPSPPGVKLPPCKQGATTEHWPMPELTVLSLPSHTPLINCQPWTVHLWPPPHSLTTSQGPPLSPFLMCSNLHLPGMPKAVYMCLKVDEDRTGVPKVFSDKTLLRYDGKISLPSITSGTRLESGSIHPVGDGLYREIMRCVYAENGHAIVEVATFCDGAGGKGRVGEIPSFLVSLPAILVDMPVEEVSICWTFWDLLTFPLDPCPPSWAAPLQILVMVPPKLLLLMPTFPTKYHYRTRGTSTLYNSPNCNNPLLFEWTSLLGQKAFGFHPSFALSRCTHKLSHAESFATLGVDLPVRTESLWLSPILCAVRSLSTFSLKGHYMLPSVLDYVVP
ncbi:uncharacterized protein LACBIDRAFT_325770 [Laccaria bicolor S238N-H82]|uniref:Predicted protein n=1 Tax=Laccaria bicolor (strain S238N-H82 / ATCC MYA-4686) TaxID=486041 RepID=B0D659_LACBS|nr:uncharacterized protein LACBIDRAFT_325770 [Laccaria bicolor S238N-H82]EDR10141.1 predicted protein [Laccaria bicolor S238N-H82]|eukprot:XP_001879526.1 predicted protein [Laccaria bicolor S238N-H82]